MLRDQEIPPGVRVLVLGRTHQPRASEWERIAAFTRALGRDLMTLGGPPVVLITGGWTGPDSADQAVVDGARKAVDGTNMDARVVTVLDADENLPPVPAGFAGTRIVPAGPRRRRRFK